MLVSAVPAVTAGASCAPARPPAIPPVAAAPRSAAALPAVRVIVFARFLSSPPSSGAWREDGFAFGRDIGDHHSQFIADVDHVFHFATAFAGKLGNVHHAVRAEQNLDERAEICDAYAFAGIICHFCGFGH